MNPSIVKSDIFYAENLIYDPLLDNDESKAVVHNLKINKALGLDIISAEFYKNALEIFFECLLKFCNYMWDKGIVPVSFERNIIYPLHKKGNKTELDNYRGISFNKINYKILISLLLQRMYKWIEYNIILVEVQAGFRSNYSTIANCLI